MHKNKKGRKGSDGIGWLSNYGWLANERVSGVDFFREDTKDAAHGISTFGNDVLSLPQGTYTYDSKNKKWVCQTCNEK
jgi:hypothetical protein